MPQARRGFQLEYKCAKEKNRGEVMVYSSISRYNLDRDNPLTTSRDFDKALKDLGDVDEITVRINSPGGAVSEAVAIRTALMKHKARKTIDIEGSCCSAATIIACLPGAKVRMAKGGDYMIHRCSWIAIGHADAMLSAYQSMTNTDSDMAEIYAERTGMSKEECLDLMTAETWYTAQGAKDAGFVDEILEAETEVEEPIAACAESGTEILKVMRECYGNVPENLILLNNKAAIAAPEEPEEKEPEPAAFIPGGEETEPDGKAPDGPEEVSNEHTAVAAGDSSENIGENAEQEGGIHMELRDATAEMLRAENPELVEEIARNAVAAERERAHGIRTLTPKGAKWQRMAEEAIANGTSEADYLRAIIAEQEKTGEEYLENRREETRKADQIGAGDTTDLDNAKEAEDRAAKDIADMAKDMSVNTTELA